MKTSIIILVICNSCVVLNKLIYVLIVTNQNFFYSFSFFMFYIYMYSYSLITRLEYPYVHYIAQSEASNFFILILSHTMQYL